MDRERLLKDRENSKYLNFEQKEILNAKLYYNGLELIEHEFGSFTNFSDKAFNDFSNTLFETYGYRPIKKYP